MLTENTITNLQEMRLSTMANAFKEQLSDKNNHLTKLIKKANFADTSACVEDITYDKA